MLHIKALGYPESSSLHMAKTIEQVFLKLNGKIEYRKKVKRIIVHDDRAAGVELEDGTIENEDIIVSAADQHATRSICSGRR
jgi:phytoene dehydrogenase-like protein